MLLCKQDNLSYRKMLKKMFQELDILLEIKFVLVIRDLDIQMLLIYMVH